MVDGKLVSCLILSFLSLALAAFVAGGATDDCSILKDTAWGKKSDETGTLYFGTTHYCVEDVAIAYNNELLGSTDCDDVGEVASILSYAGICVVLLATLVIIRRLCGNHSLRIVGIFLSLAAFLLVGVATFYFYNNCLYNSAVKGDLTFGMFAGIAAAVLLLIITILQGFADKAPNPPRRLHDSNRYYY